jgi:DNA (cytosine-5)-methyltransferase 1
MTQLKLLDLFCCQGGAARGYQMAGFHVTGIDILPQPRYIGDAFHQADALEYAAEHWREYDVIHASPPCQGYSEATPMRYRGNHAQLIVPTRQLLQATGRPYVIENVEGARSELGNSVMLCGTMFGLSLWRHRYFETWPAWFMSPATCQHVGYPIVLHEGSNTRRSGRVFNIDSIKCAMACDWMTRDGLHEAIPPAYTHWLGLQLLAALEATA